MEEHNCKKTGMKDILKPGDSILFHTKGFSPFSWGIRALTKSHWNHIGMYVEDFAGEGFVIEALTGGVVKTPIDKYINNKHYDIAVKEVIEEAFRNKDEYEEALKTAISRMKQAVGTKYDWWAIVWLGIVYISKATYRKGRKLIPLGNPLESRNKFFCSELLCMAWHGLSSIIKNIFAGEKYPEAQCSTITPKDEGKSKWVRHKWGKDIL